MNEQDARLLRQAMLTCAMRDAHKMRDPVDPHTAARFLLTPATDGQPKRVEYLLRGAPPYKMGVPRPEGLFAFSVCERDMLLVFEAAEIEGGRAIWRPGITTREAADVVMPSDGVMTWWADTLALALSRMIAKTRATERARAIAEVSS